MKKLKYLLFIFIIFLTPQVFAQNVTSSIRCSYNGSGSLYYGDPNDGFNSARCYNFGTRYSPRLGYIEFYLPTSSMTFTANTTYTVTMNMATNDWRDNIMLQNVRYINANGSVITASTSLPTMNNFRFISRKQIKFDFKLPSGTVYPYLRFILSSPTYGNPDPDISSSSYMTGDSNWNLSSIDISPVSSSGGTDGGSSGGSTGNTFDDSGIINNNNQNTTDIINNNNENTQAIIDSNKENFQTCKESVNLFNKSSVTTGSSFGSDGSIETNSYTSSNFVQETYIPVESNTSYTFSVEGSTTASRLVIMEYTGAYTFIKRNISLNSNSYTITTGSNIKFVRLCSDTSLLNKLQFQKGNKTSYEEYGKEVCTNKIDNVANAVNDTNDYLKDDSDPNIDDNEFSDLFNTVGFNDPLGYLLQLPVQFINKLVSVSNSCQTISLGTLWGVSLSLPCIDIGSIVGQQVWDIIDVLFSVGLLVVIFKNLYQTFANLMTMGGEKEAREKFSMPTPMEFLSTILGGDR